MRMVSEDFLKTARGRLVVERRPHLAMPFEHAPARKVLEDAVRQGAFPGAAYGVYWEGDDQAAKTDNIGAVGRFTNDSNSPAVTGETVFDIASVSKVAATTAMAMLLYQRGLLDLDAPLKEILPEFAAGRPGDDARARITLRMLLAHNSGLPAYERLYEKAAGNAQTLLAACYSMELEAPPLTRAVYSDIGFILLGEALKRIAGESLDTFAAREIFAPLQMTNTFYNPAPEIRATIPPTALRDSLRDHLVQGEVHDENCYVLGGVAGHAGLFSNVPDLLRFAAAILKPQASEISATGSQISSPWSRQVIDLFAQRADRPPATSRALGWDTPSTPSQSGSHFSPHSIGHLGYTGTSLWLDRERSLAIVLLTNRTYSAPPLQHPNPLIQQVRPAFYDAVIEGLMAPRW